jgi:hypothetical protein
MECLVEMDHDSLMKAVKIGGQNWEHPTISGIDPRKCKSYELTPSK